MPRPPDGGVQHLHGAPTMWFTRTQSGKPTEKEVFARALYRVNRGASVRRSRVLQRASPRQVQSAPFTPTSAPNKQKRSPSHTLGIPASKTGGAGLHTSLPLRNFHQYRSGSDGDSRGPSPSGTALARSTVPRRRREAAFATRPPSEPSDERNPGRINKKR